MLRHHPVRQRIRFSRAWRALSRIAATSRSASEAAARSSERTARRDAFSTATAERRGSVGTGRHRDEPDRQRDPVSRIGARQSSSSPAVAARPRDPVSRADERAGRRSPLRRPGAPPRYGQPAAMPPATRRRSIALPSIASRPNARPTSLRRHARAPRNMRRRRRRAPRRRERTAAASAVIARTCASPPCRV